MKIICIIILNMGWLYVTGFNGLWFSIIMTVILVVAVVANSK